MKTQVFFILTSAAAIIFAMLFKVMGVSSSQVAPLADKQMQNSISDELLRAFLAAASQPFEPLPEGFHTRSGGLDFILNASGLQTSGGDLSWGIVLSGIGRGEQINALPDAEVTQIGSRLEYRRGALTEWYRDTPLGIEQGFTIHQAPDGTEPLILALNLSSPLAGVTDTDGRGISFTSPNQQTLRYDHLRAWDAGGVPLDAKLVGAQNQVRLWVNDRGAAYPITVDPLIYTEQKVTAPDGASSDHFGYAVALDGDTALIGAYFDEIDGRIAQGSAYVFTRSGETWSLQQKLTAADDVADLAFGVSVALDGNTALVGSIGANYDLGSAYVFTRSGTTWSQQQKLIAPDGAAYRAFGVSVALAQDTALVGAYVDKVDGKIDQGSAYVFTRSGTTWTLQQKLIAPDGAKYSYFGYSVALDGETALVGAYGSDVVGAPAAGAAYVFTRSGSSWSLQQKLVAADASLAGWFGYSVTLTGDTALLGAYNDKIGAFNGQGSAYVFARSGAVWTQRQKLTAQDGAAGDRFGASVALSDNIALVGTPYDYIGSNLNQGSAYLFTRDGSFWNFQKKLTATDGGASDLFGSAVALSGNTALVGAHQDQIGANFIQGSAYFYEFRTPYYLPLILEKAP